MKLYFMKQKALDYIKANIGSLYIKYYRNTSNKWIYDLFDFEPFELFIEIPDFELASITDKKGEVDLENCKIVFSNLMRISESQASDERLWAGLCNGVFYEYLIRRYNYNNLKLKDSKKDASTVLSRFFFSGGNRAGFFRNALAKCWWIGHATYRADSRNKFELLDALGANDFSTKTSDLLYSNTFASNPTILSGICKAWDLFRNTETKLNVREHFRPALQYLNALGGGILLDALTEDEIKEIFFDYVYQLYNKKGVLEIVDEGQEFDDDEDDVDFEEIKALSNDIQFMREANTPIVETDHIEENDGNNKNVIGERTETDKKDAKLRNKLLEPPTKVTFGCVVIVHRTNDNLDFEYNIPKSYEEGTWYTIQKTLIDKQVNDEFLCAGRNYIVKEISW